MALERSWPVLRKALRVFPELLTRMAKATKLICNALQGQLQVRKEHRSSENLLQNNSCWNPRPLVTALAQHKAKFSRTLSKNRDPSTSLSTHSRVLTILMPHPKQVLQESQRLWLCFFLSQGNKLGLGFFSFLNKLLLKLSVKTDAWKCSTNLEILPC